MTPKAIERIRSKGQKRAKDLRQARRWFSELDQTSITTQQLLDFRQWRHMLPHATTYIEVERA